MKPKISIELVIAAIVGMIVSSIIYSATVSRVEARIEEIRGAQITNAEKARESRDRLEHKIDSFILLNKTNP